MFRISFALINEFVAATEFNAMYLTSAMKNHLPNKQTHAWGISIDSNQQKRTQVFDLIFMELTKP